MAFFIAREGVEGSGKTTRAGLLADWLQNQGGDALRTPEPGGCQITNQIRVISLTIDQVQQHLRRALMDCPPQLDCARP